MVFCLDISNDGSKKTIQKLENFLEKVFGCSDVTSNGIDKWVIKDKPKLVTRGIYIISGEFGTSSRRK